MESREKGQRGSVGCLWIVVFMHLFQPAVASGGEAIFLSGAGGFVGNGALDPVGVEERFQPESSEMFAVLETGLAAKLVERKAVAGD